MRFQIVALSIMFIFIFLLAPFPESDSLQNVFHLNSRDSHILTVQSLAALDQSTSSSDSQVDIVSDDESLLSAQISNPVQYRDDAAYSDNRIIRDIEHDTYQMEKLSEDIQETQVSRSDQISFSPKSSFYATSINGGTMSTRYRFGFKDRMQNQHPLMQRNSIKQYMHRQQAPSSVQDNWNLPGTVQSNSLNEPRIQQQIHSGTSRGIRQTPGMQREQAPSVRSERRTAFSLTNSR